MPAAEPPNFSPELPASSRVCDYLSDGHDWYEADRELGKRIEGLCPEAREMAAANREFLARAVTWAAQQDIRQFLDLGSGFPGAGSVRDHAQAATPDATVACVDHDPIVSGEDGYAPLLEEQGVKNVSVVLADIQDPAAVLAHPAVTGVIDLGERVALVFGLVLHHLPARRAWKVAAGCARLIAPGSLIVISVPRFDDAEMFRQIRQAYTPARLHNHALATVASFLTDLELVPPGIVAAQNWRGGWHDVPITSPGPGYVLSAVARKPGRTG
jgi:hypothetical protein